MNEFKEFEAKSIDEAIEAACAHFDGPRELLELEIVQDAKGGIFGLGVKKAMVRARRRDNHVELKNTVTTVVERLVAPIVGSGGLDMEVSVDDGRVKVVINDDDHSGLIIGREGQTLSALQYLVNRIVARRSQEPVRVQLDTGDYRERQDDNLRQLALHLADKARSLGRSQSTKPLSSYHRRVVHMALQGDGSIMTRSKGEGPLKRVIILPKRDRRPREANREQSRASED